MEIVKIGDQRRQSRLIEPQEAHRHRELEGLPLVVHVGSELDVTVARRDRVGVEPCPRLGDEVFEQRLDRAKVLGLGVENARADEIMDQIRMQNAVGRQRAGILREHDASDPGLVRDRDRVQPGGATEGDHREFARIDAFLEQRQTDRGAQIGVDDREQSLRRGFDRKAERFRYIRVDRGARCFAVERHPAAQKVFAVEPAKREIGIGHGRSCSPAAIAGGAWARAGAFGPDCQSPVPLHLGERAAARADGADFDHRNAHRHAVDLTLHDDVDATVEDDRDVEACPAHVDADEVIFPEDFAQQRAGCAAA